MPTHSIRLSTYHMIQPSHFEPRRGLQYVLTPEGWGHFSTPASPIQSSSKAKKFGLAGKTLLAEPLFFGWLSKALQGWQFVKRNVVAVNPGWGQGRTGCVGSPPPTSTTHRGSRIRSALDSGSRRLVDDDVVAKTREPKAPQRRAGGGGTGTPRSVCHGRGAVSPDMEGEGH